MKYSIISECKFVFYTGIPHAGTTFLFSVLDKNPEICTIMLTDDLFDFLAKNDFSKEHKRSLGIKKYYSFIEKISERIDEKYSILQVKEIIEPISGLICKMSNYYENICMILDGYSVVSIREIIITLFQAKMICEDKNIKNISHPVFVFDAHSRIDALLKHSKIIETFDDFCFFSSYRNPLYITASSIKSDYYISSDVAYRLLKMNIFSFLQDISDEWRKKYYISKFEDEKLYPEETFRTICHHFGVEYCSTMMTANETGPTCRGYEIRGFDTEPVTRKLDDVFSEADMIFLKSIYQVVLRKYGYEDYFVDDVTFENKVQFEKTDEKYLIHISGEELQENLMKIFNEIKKAEDDWFFPMLIER